MANLITFETLIDNLNTELNTLATTLKTSGDIERELSFAIVPHYQDNEEEKDYAEDVRIGAVAVRLAGGFRPSQQYQGYNERILVTFDAFTNDSHDMDYLLNEYANQNTGKLIKSLDWVYSASFEKPQFIDRSVDKGNQRVVVFFEILYSFVFKGIISDDITLKINGTTVPVLSYASKIEKRGPVTDTIVIPGEEKAFYTSSLTSKTIKFIHINDTEINNILEDIDSGEYLNRQYTIFYGVGCDENDLNCLYDKTHTMVLQTGTVDYTEGGFQQIEATFLPYNSL